MEKTPPVIDDKAFDNPFGRWAEELDPYCEGDKVGVMATLMAAFSAYIGKDVKAKTKRGLSPLSCWFVLVGDSGEARKGATSEIAMPVIQKAFPAWAAEHYLDELPNTGLGIMTELNEHRGNPVFFLHEEMDDFIDSAKGDKKIGTRLRGAWSGKTLRHKNSKIDIKIEEPHMAFVGHVQPENWKAVLGTRDATGGTYNRMLALRVIQSKDVPTYYGPDPDEAIDKVASQMKEVGELIREMGSEIPVPPDVAKRFEEHHKPICQGFTRGNKQLSQMAERAMAYLIRIAPLFAIADLREEVSEKDFDSALELIRYSVESTRFILPNMGGESLAQKILAAVQRRHREKAIFPDLPDISLSEVWDEIGRNWKSDQVNKALGELPQISRYEGKSTGGRRPTRLKLNVELEEKEEVTA